MRQLKILFMGTPDFAVLTLQSILESGYEVVGVITAPDRPAGRGRKLKGSAVKEFAVSKNLTVLQPTNLKDAKFIEEVKGLKANLNIVVAFRMLPQVVWDMPAYGTFNLHASLLPEYRGAAPINWALINGEQKTGVTTFFIDEKIDTGRIILQKEVLISNDDTVGTLHDTLMTKGAALVLDTLKQIAEETIDTQVQAAEGHLKTAYKLNKENTKIDWTQDPKTICNLVKGLSPYPVAWCYLYNNDEKVSIKIYEVSTEPNEHTHDIGKISIEESMIKVTVKNGYIKIHQLQLPGKKQMPSKALLNGYTFSENAKMG